MTLSTTSEAYPQPDGKTSLKPRHGPERGSQTLKHEGATTGQTASPDGGRLAGLLPGCEAIPLGPRWSRARL
jgi:hypothetical protein